MRKGSLVKIMDIRKWSVEPDRQRKNDRAKVLRDMELRCFWNTTLSKKGRGVKMLELMFELNGNGGGRQIKLFDFWF